MRAEGAFVIVRQAGTGDAGAIAGILNQAIRGTLATFAVEERDPTDIAREIALNGGGTLVADAEGEVVGFAVFAPFRRGSGYVHTMEHSIHLLPLYRGQGIGRALLTRLENVAVRQGIHVMVAGISGANPDAVAFHARLGYREVGRMPEVGRKSRKWLDSYAENA